MKTPQTQKELENHFDEQLSFLTLSCDSYDEGNHAEAKRIALTIRVLLHHTSRSTSLINQLALGETKFLSTSFPLPEDPSVKIAHKGLISVFMGDDSPTFYVPLDAAPFKKDLNFDDWWNEVVLVDQEGNEFSRKTLIACVANQDGGAHVDPELKSEYANLSRNNSLGNNMQKDGEWVAMKTPELATVRQIGHEVLKTLLLKYEKQPISRGDGLIIGPMKLHFGSSLPLREHGKIGRNDQCVCGKDIKYKKCCGKA